MTKNGTSVATTTDVSTGVASSNAYTDSVAQGLTSKRPVRACSTTNITLSGFQTIDGVTLIAADRVLVAGQTTASQNGLYCVDEETEILTRDGFMRHDVLIPGTDVLTFNVKTGLAEWQPLESVHRFEPAEREVLSMETPTHSSLSTLDHRWPVERRRNRPAELAERHRDSKGRYVEEEATVGPWWIIRRSAELTGHDFLITTAPVANLPTEAKYEDAFVELVAWFITEGHIRVNNSGTISTGVRIVQSQRVNPDYVLRIRRCLTALYGPEVPMMRRKRDGWRPEWRQTLNNKTALACFSLNTIAGAELLTVAPNRECASDFITSLTEAQLRLFVNTCIAADGWSSADGKRRTIAQKSRSTVCILFSLPVRFLASQRPSRKISRPCSV